MTTLNEQMREKAKELLVEFMKDAPTCDYPEESIDGGKLLEEIHAERLQEELGIRIATALTEAHAAGRQEILDRLPSDIEIAEAYDAKRAAVGGRGNTIHMMAGWIEAYREIKSRLTGEV